MRNGDFSEVAAAYSNFQLYNPSTGGADGVGRDAVRELHDPGEPDQPGRQTSCALPGAEHDPGPQLEPARWTTTLTAQRVPGPRQLRREADLPAHASHSIWGKFGMLDNEGTGNNFILGFDDGSLGDTRIYVGTSATPGRSAPRSCSTATSASTNEPDGDRPRLRHELGTELGIPGANGERRSATAACPLRIGATRRLPDRQRRAGCRCSARSAARRSAPPSPRSCRSTSSAPASTSSATSSTTGSRSSATGLQGGFTFDGIFTGAPATPTRLEPVRRLPARPAEQLLKDSRRSR